MGVEGLYKFINKHCSEIYKNVSIFDVKDKSCIIDGMQHIYTQLIYMRSKNKEIMTTSGKNISHIHGLINSLTYYLKNGIIPIFIFDGKSPDIKKKKIEERKQILKQNLKKLRELESIKNDIQDNTDSILVGTPPEFFNLSDEMQKMQDVQDEYKKIYKKSIILKDYFVTDWIQILEFLGLPVIKAKGEADPLCAYVLKNNSNVYGIISDDSDMLVFGAPRLMRKSINQQFTIIELDELISSINKLLSKDELYSSNNTSGKKFEKSNLIDFSLLLGTDYAIFKLQKDFSDAYTMLKYYMLNGVEQMIFPEDIEKFYQIKKYYENLDFDESFKFILEKPVWNKPKLLELKKRLLELYVDEDFIDKNNELFDFYYNKYLKKSALSSYNDFNFRNRKNMLNNGKIFDNNYATKYYSNRPPIYPNRKNIFMNSEPAENINTYDTYNSYNSYNTHNMYNTHNTHNTYNTYGVYSSYNTGASRPIPILHKKIVNTKITNTDILNNIKKNVDGDNVGSESGTDKSNDEDEEEDEEHNEAVQGKDDKSSSESDDNTQIYKLKSKITFSGGLEEELFDF